MTELDKESEEVRDIYAHFGLAYYTSGVFEYGLVLAITTADFISKQAAEMRTKGPKKFDRAAYERNFDNFIDGLHQKETMGKLIVRIKGLTNMNDDFKEELRDALRRRNYLAHHFFRHHAENFVRRAGREKMLSELQDHQEFFERIDKKLEAFMRPIREQVGMPDELVKPHVEEYMREIREVEV